MAGGRKVFIADDEMMIRQALKAILHAGKFQVVGEAAQGNEVVPGCERHQPDILCLDINMPKMDGLEVLAEVRRRFPEMRVVMISGDATSGKVKQAIELGACDYIVKPFNASSILQHMGRVVESRQGERSGDQAGS